MQSYVCREPQWHPTKHMKNNSNQKDVSCPSPKWGAVIDDSPYSLPRAVSTARDILDQIGSPSNVSLKRDYSSAHDHVFADDEVVNLVEGNVFVVVSKCDAVSCRDPNAKPKLAFILSVKDSWEITVNPNQTGKSLKRLLGVADEDILSRDMESPDDVPVGDDDSVVFSDGPVFVVKQSSRYCINIEGKNYDWSKATITTAEIRTLGNLPADQQVVCEDAEGRERTLREDEVVNLDPCCRFGRAPKYKRG